MGLCVMRTTAVIYRILFLSSSFKRKWKTPVQQERTTGTGECRENCLEKMMTDWSQHRQGFGNPMSTQIIITIIPKFFCKFARSQQTVCSKSFPNPSLCKKHVSLAVTLFHLHRSTMHVYFNKNLDLSSCGVVILFFKRFLELDN